MQSHQLTTALSRRGFLKTAAAAGLVLMSGGLAFPGKAGAAAFTAPPLPYPENALEPYISARTVSFHYGKHTMGYFNNVNKLLEGNPLASLPLDKVFLKAASDPAQIGVFRNAAQAWNHQFYWSCMAPGGGKTPNGKILDAINAAFGDFGTFRNQLAEAATTQFASGWAWLVEDKGALKVVKTPNAMNPMVDGAKPLLTIDVWEHAYYLDYQNRRGDYVTAFLDNLVNWDYVAKNMG